MSFLWGMILLLLLVLWALSIYDIVRRRLGGKRTVAWILIVVILPVIGTILYWAVRPSEPGDAEHTYEADRSRREDAQRRVF
jgi:Phospholipase_D-nuclease N-terminal